MGEPVQLPLFPEPTPAPQHHGLQILLRRMDTHPQEFSLVHGPWASILAAIVSGTDRDVELALEQREKDEVIQKLKHVCRENFSAGILRILTTHSVK